MAEMGYGCVFGDCKTQPNHLLTTINPPSTVETCDEHYAPSLIPILAAELGLEPGDFYASVERYIAREAKKAERALAEAQAAEAAKGSQGPAADANAAAAEHADIAQAEAADAAAEGGVMDTAP
jgi:hypothetical protein